MPKHQKELPHTTVETFKLLMPKLPEFRRECVNLDDLAQSLPEEKLDASLIGEWFWAPIYELTFLEHTSWVIHVLGKTPVIQAALQSDNFNRFDDDPELGHSPPMTPSTSSYAKLLTVTLGAIAAISPGDNPSVTGVACNQLMSVRGSTSRVFMGDVRLDGVSP